MTDFFSPNANAASKPLTLEDLRKAQDLMAQAVAEAPVVYCHPLQYPFWCVFYGEVRVMDFDRVVGWYFECLRKHRMGAKTGDPRWTTTALISQYTAKIAAIEVVEWPKTDILKGI